MIPKDDLLKRVRIASPCPASWDAMEGDERVRFCGSCRRSVYNLSGMSRSEAEQVIRQSEGRLCVRLYRRRDGTVLTRDCPVGIAAIRKRFAMAIVRSAAVVLFVYALVARPLGARTAAASHREPPAVSALDDPAWRAQQPAPVRVLLDWILPVRPVIMGAVALAPPKRLR